MRQARGVSLIEVVFASVLLAGGVVVVYGLIHQGARFGVDLAGRERADLMARTLLDRYRGLPPTTLALLVGEAGEVDVASLDDPGLAVLGAPLEEGEAAVRAIPIPGRLGAVALEAAAARAGKGDLRRRTLTTPGTGLREGLAAASGFRHREEDPTWGSARDWVVPPRGEGDPPPPASFAEGVAARARRARAAWVDREFRDAAEIHVHGDLTRARQAAAPGGVLRARHGAPAALRRLRAEALTGAFEERTGIGNLLLGDREIPAGDYVYTLDVLDRRAFAEPPDLVGVYQLRAGAARHDLVGRATRGPAPTRELRGDRVLASHEARDPAGRPWRVLRTEEHLTAIEGTRGELLRRLRILDLPAMDGSAEGTAATRRFVADALRSWDFEESPEPGPDELEDAAGRGRLPPPR